MKKYTSRIGRPPTGETPKWQFRCPVEIRERITALAERHGMSATEFIINAILEKESRLARPSPPTRSKARSDKGEPKR